MIFVNFFTIFVVDVEATQLDNVAVFHKNAITPLVVATVVLSKFRALCTRNEIGLSTSTNCKW